MFHHAPASDDPLKKLSAELHLLSERFAERRVTLGEVMEVLGARVSGLLIIILALAGWLIRLAWHGSPDPCLE